MQNRVYGFFLSIVLLAGSVACSERPVELGVFDYAAALSGTCPSLPAAEDTSSSDGRTAGGIRYTVRAPANYDPTRAHRLLVVYAAATHDRRASERFTALTLPATAAGFIVVYVDHRRLSGRVLDDLATIPAAVEKHWCVDPNEIYLIGHSDGGTTAAAMAFRPDDGLTPAGFAASAAGVRAEDLAEYECPAPMRVMILHNAQDELFPGYGRSHVEWWARCQQCVPDDDVSLHNTCRRFKSCNAPVAYCERAGTHRQWPELNEQILEFFISDR